MAAIYQWFYNEGVLVLTTTLYPIEYKDELQISCDIVTGEMQEIQSDAHTQSGDLLSIELYPILINYGPDNEDHKQSGDLTSIAVNQILLIYDPDNEDHRQSGDLTSITLNLKVVTIDTPDEKLQLDCDITPSDCSMSNI